MVPILMAVSGIMLPPTTLKGLTRVECFPHDSLYRWQFAWSQCSSASSNSVGKVLYYPTLSVEGREAQKVKYLPQTPWLVTTGDSGSSNPASQARYSPKEFLHQKLGSCHLRKQKSAMQEPLQKWKEHRLCLTLQPPPVSHPSTALTLRICPPDAPLCSSFLRRSLVSNCFPLLYRSISHMSLYPGLALCLISAPEFLL